MATTEKRLKESEEKFRSLVETTSDWIWEVDNNGVYTYSNPKVKDILGYEVNEIIGKTPFDIMPPDEAEKVLVLFQKAIEMKEPITIIKNKNIHKDGYIVTLETSGVPFFDDNGALMGYRGIDRDITEKLEAERKLKESEEKYRNLFSNAPFAIVLFNIEGTILDCNDASGIITGYSKEELIGKNFRNINFYVDVNSANIEVREEKVKDGKIPKTRDILLYKKDGSQFWARTNIEFIYLKDKTYLQTIIQDVSEQKESQIKLEESEEKYSNLFQHSNDGIFLHDLDGNITDANQKVLEQLGYKKSEILSLNIAQLHLESELVESKKAFEEISKKGFVSFEINFKKKNGDVFPAEVSSSLFTIGEKTYVQGVMRDITIRNQNEIKLKESEIQFRNLYEEAPTAYLSIGQDKSIIRCNRAAEKLLGYTKDEFLKMKVFDLYADTENGIGAAKITFKKFLDGESIKDVELQMKNKDGNPIWISLYVKPIFDQEGNVIESRSMILDITERRKAEEALKESEEKFRTITEQSFLGIAIQQDNIIKYVNNQLAQTFGYTVEEIMNWEVGGFLNVIHLEDRELVAKQARKKQLGESDSIDQYQFRGIKKNGDIIWLEIYSKSINYNGKQANFVTIHDITDGKIFEQKLLESEEKFRSIFETIPDLFFLVSSDSTILDYKGNLEELYLPPEEFLGKKLGSLMPESVAVLSLNSITKTLETHEPQIIEYNLDMNGENRFYEARHLYFTEEKVLVFVRDITDRKKTQENLLISEKKFKESYDRANFYKDLFAHDMSNILQVINSSAELILFQLGDSEKSRNITNIATIIKKQIERGAKLISNVRTLSELKDEEVITKRVGINKFIKNAISFVKKAYERRNIKISFESVSKKHYTNANELLQDVFENVLINGIKYNENSVIEISIKISKQEVDAKDYIKIEFIDNGIGVSDERKEVIFLSGNRELKGSKGMGLGLSLVSKILSIFKGEIRVENKIKGDYSKGSNFVILLPEVI